MTSENIAKSPSGFPPHRSNPVFLNFLPLSALFGFAFSFTWNIVPGKGMIIPITLCIFTSWWLHRKQKVGMAILFLAVATLFWSFTWSRTLLITQDQSLPSAEQLGKPFLLKGTAGSTYQTDYGYSTLMNHVIVLSPLNNSFKFNRLRVYYPDSKSRVFPRGETAVFWATIKEKFQPKPVPSTFQSWSERYSRRFTGSIKDIRLIKTAMQVQGNHRFLSPANLELLSFFSKGIPAYEWSNRLAPFGVGHLLSVSGLHCGLFYLLLKIGLLFLRRPIWRHVLTLLGLLGFASWMGWSNSVTRAASMLMIWELMPLLNMRRNWISIWWAVLLVILTFQPEALLSKGLWYTFAASLGLIAGARAPNLLERNRIEHPWLHKLRWGLPLLSAQLCVIPINLMFSASSRPMSIFWNMMGLAFLFILLALFLLSLLALFWHNLAFIPNFWDNQLQSFLEHLQPFADFQIFYRFPGHPLLVLSILCILIYCLFHLKSEIRWYACLLVLACFLGFNRPHTGERLVMVDTGQGLCTLLTTDTGEAFIFDCGGKVPYPLSLKTICNLYGARKITKIFISHANMDHYGLYDQLDNDHTLYLPRGQYDYFQNLLHRLPKSVIELNRGDQLTLGTSPNSWNLEVLWPYTGNTTLDLNDTGLVLLLTRPNNQILMTGDAGKKVESRLIFEPLKGPSILQVGHHGSKTSSSLAFIKKVKPGMALISAGKNNPFGHPHADVLARFLAQDIPVFCTNKRGTIEIDLGKTPNLVINEQ